METLSINASFGKVRHVTKNGRAYLVAPMSLIVPGVLPGSKGALYYPPDEVQARPGIWNNQPITVGHPTDATGNHVPASSVPHSHIGFLANDHYHKGKRRAEGWFDLEATRKLRPDLIDNLTSGRPMELSTGLYTDNEERVGTSPGGRAYIAIARNYRPDHLAVLPDQVGACSMQDGCGVLINANPEGHNQYTGSSGQAVDKMQHTPDTVAALYHKVNDDSKQAEVEHEFKSLDTLPKNKSGAAWKAMGFTGRGTAEKIKETISARHGGITSTRMRMTPASMHTPEDKAWFAGRAKLTENVENYLTIKAPAAGGTQGRGPGGRFGAGGGGQQAQGGPLGPEDEDQDEEEEGAEGGDKKEEKKPNEDKKKDEAAAYGGAEAQSRYEAYKDRTMTKNTLWQKLGRLLGLTTNSNPEGHNQYTHSSMDSPEESGYVDVEKNGTTVGSATRIDKGKDAGKWKAIVGGKHVSTHAGHEDAVAAVKTSHAATRNAGINQPRHAEAGTYLPHGSGTGKGPVHGAAKEGGTHPCPTCGKADCSCEDETGGASGSETPEGVTNQAILNAHIQADQDMLVNFSSDEERKAAFAAMAEGGESSSNARDASKRADKKNTPAAHKTAAAAHKEAAEYHANEGNTEHQAAHEAAAKHHESTARKLGKATNNSQGDLTMTREQILTTLTANCKCDEDRAALNALADETIQGLWEAKRPTINAPPPAEGSAEEEETEGSEEEAQEQARPPFGGKKGKGKMITENQVPLTSRLTPDELQVWNTAVEITNHAKHQLVTRLTAAVLDPTVKARLTANLMAKDVPSLRDLVVVLPPVDNRQGYAQPAQETAPLYYGQSAPMTANYGADSEADRDDILPLPTLNYKELAKEQRQQA